MWTFYAIMASLCNGIFLLGNQWAKTSPTIFMVYRGWIPVLLLLPLSYFAPVVEDWRFYAVCGVLGGIIAFNDYRNFRAIQVWGAETISSIHPFSIGVVFCAWLVLKPTDLLFYFDDLPRFFIIMAALVGVILSVSGYRSNRNGRKALKYMVPFLIVFGIGDICNKLAMGFVDADQQIYGSYWYILITAAIVGVIHSVIYFRQGGSVAELSVVKNIKCFLAILPLIALMGVKNLAMYNAPNPSYVSALLYLYVIWIMLAGMGIRMVNKHYRYKVIPARKVLLLLISISLLILFGR